MKNIQYKRYKKIRRKKRKKIFFIIFLFLFFLGIFSLFVWSPLFKIKEIKLEGDFLYLEKKNLEDYIFAQIKKNFLRSQSIFCFSKKRAILLLSEKFPPINSIEVKKIFPHTLVFKIQERKPVAIFFKDNNEFLIDQTGFVFSEKRKENLLILEDKRIEPKIGSKILDEVFLQKILNAIATIKKDLNLEAQKIVLNEFSIEIQTNNGPILILSPQKSLEEQIEDLEILALQEIKPENLNKIEYIDLRFEKIFFKRKSDQGI